MVGLVMISACFRIQQDVDGGSADGSVPDATGDAVANDSSSDDADEPGDADCPTLGVYRACGRICEQECPESNYCSPPHQVCMSARLPFRQGSCRAYFPDDDPRVGLVRLRGCYGHEVCVGERDEGSGRCVDPSYCADALRYGVSHRHCYHHHDQSTYLGEAPLEECPSSPDDLTAFCGMTCPAECPLLRRADGQIPPLFRDLSDDEFDRQCAGVTEERSIGVCTVGPVLCSPPGTSTDNPDMEHFESYYERPFACLLIHDRIRADVPYGFITTRDACLTWVRRYPGAGECYDADKNLIDP